MRFIIIFASALLTASTLAAPSAPPATDAGLAVRESTGLHARDVAAIVDELNERDIDNIANFATRDSIPVNPAINSLTKRCSFWHKLACGMKIKCTCGTF